MKKRSKKGILLIIIVSVIILFLILTIYYLINKNVNIKNILTKKVDVIFTFVLEDKKEKDLDVFTETFEPDQIVATINGVDSSDLIMIDTNDLNLKKVGKYYVKYYLIYKNKRYEEVQTINVVDNIPPVISLNGDNITILVGEKYKELGYMATDNYDGDITDKVEIENHLDNTKVGKYEIIYKVIDSNGNEMKVSRLVTVKKPNTVVVTPPKEVKVETPKVIESNYSNTIKNNKFTNNNIHLEGYIGNSLEENKIKLVGDETYEYDLIVTDNHYSIDINPDEVNNGKYIIYINDEVLLNKMAIIERIIRAKVGNKLVSFNYNDKDEVSIEIANHTYQYDILINPGHGGEDTGAVNEYVMEKEMNLIVSMYEKCRYEAHGLNVYMTRTSDTYGANFGPTSLIKLHRIGYEIGYYGAVSRVVYSNHHNSINNNYYSGYEILVPGSLTREDLSNELTIANKWNGIFDLKENHNRFYARNSDTDSIHSKLNGEVYSFKDYYAINRIPLAISNVKSIIFEGSYMSNKEEFNWYWQNGNWRKVSEAKIEVYVNYLGKTYNNDNSSCI